VDLIALAHSLLAHRRYANAGDVVTAQKHLAVGRLNLACQHLEEGGLAGAVGPDKASQLALGNADGYPLDCLEAAIVFGNVVRTQYWRTCRNGSCLTHNQWCCCRSILGRVSGRCGGSAPAHGARYSLGHAACS